MQTIHVGAGAPYDVLIGDGALASCGEYIAALPGKRYQRLAVVTDSNVHDLYSAAVEASLRTAGYDTSTFVFPYGESSKSLSTATDLLTFLNDSEITRTDAVVALGGGVVGDLAGFAASVHLRGVDYIQIPTTLLAAVDSSVGGKTAVNIPAGKNLVGTFWQPQLVVCDPRTMDTLDQDIYLDGVSESIKYGCIWDEDLFALFEGGLRRDDAAGIIARCVGIKAQVVMEDERDNALRQILNFGHTVGHAVEKLSGFSLSHGKGVAIGMCMAAASGETAGITPAGTTARIRAVLEQAGLPTSCGYSVAELARACLGDKKRSGDSINLILLEKMGRAVLHPVPVSGLEAFLSSGEAVS